MFEKEKEEQMKIPFKIGGDSSLGFEKELEIIESLFDYEENELIELLNQHPDALLLHKKVAARYPDLILKLKKAKPEIYLQLFENDGDWWGSLDPFSDYENSIAIGKSIFNDDKLATENADVAELLYFCTFQIDYEFPFYVDKHRELMKYALLSSKNFTSSFPKLENKEDFSLLTLKKVILDHPENIQFLPNAPEELKELAILLKPTCIHLIHRPSDHLKKVAISLDSSLANSINELPSTLKWIPLIKNDLESMENLSASMKQYVLLSDPTKFSELTQLTDYQKLLALKIDCGSFNSMTNLSNDMINFMVKIEPNILRLMDEQKEEWLETALTKDLCFLSKLEGDKRYLFELALKIANQKSIVTHQEVRTLVGQLPSSRLSELENDLNRIIELNIDRLDEIYPIQLPFKLPNYQFEKIFSKYPFLLEISEDNVYDDKLSLMRIDSRHFIEKGGSEEENRLLLQQQFISHDLRMNLKRKKENIELFNSSLNKHMTRLMVDSNISLPMNEQLNLGLDSSATWNLLQENPMNLALIPLKHRSFRICRSVGRLNHESLIFSPFHLDEYLDDYLNNNESLIEEILLVDLESKLIYDRAKDLKSKPAKFSIDDDDLPF